jgi:hypothetical protein
MSDEVAPEEPKPEGARAEPERRDFLCIGAPGPEGAFQCIGQFTCEGMADDFRCWDEGTLAFNCPEWFAGCWPSGPSGIFRCDRVHNEFFCPSYLCPSGRFSDTP